MPTLSMITRSSDAGQSHLPVTRCRRDGDTIKFIQQTRDGAEIESVIIPMGARDANVNVKAYKEFAGANRPEGWNLWVTYALSPADPAAARTTAPPRRMYAK